MICVSLAGKKADEIFSILERPDVEMAEIRLDTCPLDAEEIEDLFASVDKPLIATCRVTEECPAAEAEARMLTAIKAGAAYVDIDMDAPAMMSKRLRREARECGSLLIRSFHDYDGTDSAPALAAIAEKCSHLGADIIKIVTAARSEADVNKVLSLYDHIPPQDLVAFCMSPEGEVSVAATASRISCLAKGAPFTYAALTESEATAPGQMTLEQMRNKVYGAKESLGTKTIEVCCSKSVAQRAIIIAAIADGTSHLYNYTPCADSEAAISAAEALGAKVERNGSTLTIEGSRHIRHPEKINAGESGFLARMIIPLLAALDGKPFTIEGEKTLLKRPLPGSAEMLAAFGLEISGEKIPMTVSGHLKAGEVSIDGKYGSQLVSGLIAALPLLPQTSEVRLVNPKSIPYIFMTLDILRRFGVSVGCDMEGGEEFAQTQDWNLCEAITFRIKGERGYKAADIDLEADWSAASNFLVAGSIFGEAHIAGLDTKSLQADLAILDILPMAGACISQEEESGIVNVAKGPLRGFELDASHCPDLVPILSVLAAFCQGTTKISGVARLAGKESDRVSVIIEFLRKMGVKCSTRPDKLIIEGRSLTCRLLTGTLLKGGNFESHGDHRIAMALRIAALGADSPVEIEDEACTAKSFPAFGQTFNTFAK